MEEIQEYVSLARAKSTFIDLVRKVKGTDDVIAITNNGVPEVVLLSIEKFEGLLESLDILSDEKAMKSIRKSIQEAKKGEWIDLDEAFGNGRL